MAAKTLPQVTIEARSMLVVTTPPDLLGDGDQQREFHVRVDRGVQRRLQVGDHVDPGHPLVGAYPDHFAPSAEVVDVALVAVVPAEVLARQRAEQLRRAPRPAEAIRPVCENCGQRSDVEVILPPQPRALDVAAALDFAETLEERERVRFQSVHAQRAYLAAVKARADAFAVFQHEHALCPADAELCPLPEPPARAEGELPPVWSGPVSFGRSLGRG